MNANCEQTRGAEIVPSCEQTLAAVLGDDAMDALCAAFGGFDFYLPSSVHPDSALVLHIGYQAACRLVTAFGPVRIYVPMPGRDVKRQRDWAMFLAYKNGETISDLARRNHMTRRQARNIISMQRRMQHTP